jgi:hypothetical protein
MRTKSRVVGLTFMIATLFTMSVYAWSILEDHGSTVLIRCADGSNSTVSSSDGTWTVVSAGNNGKTGAQFAIVGQAALSGCGE